MHHALSTGCSQTVAEALIGYVYSAKVAGIAAIEQLLLLNSKSLHTFLVLSKLRDSK